MDAAPGFAMGVGQLHRLTEVVIRKITGEGPHAKLLPRKVNCISTKMERHFQTLHIPCRSQKLRQMFDFLRILNHT